MIVDCINHMVKVIKEITLIVQTSSSTNWVPSIFCSAASYRYVVRFLYQCFCFSKCLRRAVNF